MAFALTPMIKIGGDLIPLAQVRSATPDHGPADAEGILMPELNGKALMEPVEPDPILRLATAWLIKLPWILAGDQECVALRNSPFCFGFEPRGSRVEFYFYEGTDDEVENLVTEPINVTLDQLGSASVAMGRALLAWAAAHPQADLAAEVEELTVALREGELAYNRLKHADARSASAV